MCYFFTFFWTLFTALDCYYATQRAGKQAFAHILNFMRKVSKNRTGGHVYYRFVEPVWRFISSEAVLHDCFYLLESLELHIICRTCAYEYEKGHEGVTASLAFKCAEVAYLRLVYCKSSATHRVWHDLQSCLRMVPQGMLIFGVFFSTKLDNSTQKEHHGPKTIQA